jgi:hypothetical protein
MESSGAGQPHTMMMWRNMDLRAVIDRRIFCGQQHLDGSVADPIDFCRITIQLFKGARPLLGFYAN